MPVIRNDTYTPLQVAGCVRLATAAALSLLLASCASLGDRATPPAPVAPAPAVPASTRRAEIPVLDTDVAGNQELIDAINREGRVLQLGAFSETAPPVTPPENDVVELNYEQEELRVVIEQLGGVLNLNMVIDPTIDSRVSLRTSPDNPMRYEDIWPLLRLLTRNAGVTIEQAGNVYEFKRNPARIPTTIVSPDNLDEAGAGEVMQVTPLTFISAEAAEAALGPMLQPEGTIVRLGPSNLIGINGTPEQLTRVNALLAVLDDDPFLNRGIRIFPLQNSGAASVAEELTNILQLVEGELSSYQVLGLERINAVLVVAPAGRGFTEVERWMQILDATGQEQVEQLFVYRVKSLKAPALAETLTSVFGDAEARAERNLRLQQRQEQSQIQGSRFQPAVPEAVPTDPALNAAAQAPDANTGLAQINPAGGAVESAISADGAEAAANSVSANLSVSIVADEDTNALLIRATPREYRQLLMTISSLDVVPQQVLINAVIGQVTLTESTEFGIDWTRVSGNAASGSARLGSRFLPSSLFDPATGALVRGPGSGLILTRTFMDGSAVIDATLRAIAQDNEVDLLARPTLLATNNQEGQIMVGQEVPVNNGSTIGLGGQQIENIAYRPVGIELTITPQINADGFVNLQIFQSLSSISDASGVGNNPIFQNQEITTTVVVSDQSTIALGGLIQDDNADLSTGVPLLQKIPVLGALFSYQEFRNERRELFIILRPQIIRGDGSDIPYLQQLRDSFTNVSTLMREAGL